MCATPHAAAVPHPPRSEDEHLRRHGKGQSRRNDDGILDCLLLFAARGAQASAAGWRGVSGQSRLPLTPPSDQTTGGQVELVTADLAMRARVRNEGLLAHARAEALPRLEALLSGDAPPLHVAAPHDAAPAAAAGEGGQPSQLVDSKSNCSSCSDGSQGPEEEELEEGELPPGFGGSTPAAAAAQRLAPERRVHDAATDWMHQQR